MDPYESQSFSNPTLAAQLRLELEECMRRCVSLRSLLTEFELLGAKLRATLAALKR